MVRNYNVCKIMIGTLIIHYNHDMLKADESIFRKIIELLDENLDVSDYEFLGTGKYYETYYPQKPEAFMHWQRIK